ncbi:MAG: hypothetical protein ACTSO9_07345 [Candidatus Helarchaeota archaeon]
MSEKRVKLGVIANLFQMVIEIYTDEKTLENLDKINGKEIVLEFPALEGSVLFRIFDRKVVASVGDSDQAVSRIIVKADEDQIVNQFSSITTSDDSFRGLLRFLKLWITRKIGIKGSKLKARTFFRCLMVGKLFEQ